MSRGSKALAESALRTLFETGTVVGRSDDELLDRFLTAGRPAAEMAFAALVERHGLMVWRVCHDVLRESSDADDAFQATFLVLARRATAIRKRSSLGPWLYGVALRVSRSSRSRVLRRRKREQIAAGRMQAEPMADVDRLDAASILHEEVGRLPEKYRMPVVLCYFEGLTHDQAASHLGWPVGTVRSRLAKARDRLRPDLLRRGVAPSLATALATGRAEAMVSATVGMAVGAGAAGTVPAAVAALVGTVLREMTIMKTSMIATCLVVATLVGTSGVGYVAARAQVGEKVVTSKQNEQTPKADAAGSTSTGTDAGRERIIPQGSNFRPGLNSSGVLWAKLSSAAENLRLLEAQHKATRIGYSEVSKARGEVEALAAELNSGADDLNDEVELLGAQLEIKKAEVQATKSQLVKAMESYGHAERLAKSKAVSQSEARQLQLEGDYRSAELAKKRAELNEVELRIKQATRRRDEANTLVKRAKELIPDRASPSNPAGAATKR